MGEGACPGDTVSAPPLAAPGQVELPDIPERSMVGFRDFVWGRPKTRIQGTLSLISYKCYKYMCIILDKLRIINIRQTAVIFAREFMCVLPLSHMNMPGFHMKCMAVQ